jgi:hypothetical protein
MNIKRFSSFPQRHLMAKLHMVNFKKTNEETYSIKTLMVKKKMVFRSAFYY